MKFDSSQNNFKSCASLRDVKLLWIGVIVTGIISTAYHAIRFVGLDFSETIFVAFIAGAFSVVYFLILTFYKDSVNITSLPNIILLFEDKHCHILSKFS